MLNVQRKCLPCRNIPGNVAYGKTAWQTGAYGDLIADKAVDGRLHDGSNYYCAHPFKQDGTQAQWTVDLQDNYQLYNITLYNTRDLGGRIARRYIIIPSML